jgi:glutamate-5-semialdehyde dehydrogenase
MNLTPLFAKVSQAGRILNTINHETIDLILSKISEEAITRADYILAENARDLALMDENNPLYDRLMLNKGRISSIASDILNVSKMKSPLGRVLSESIRPNGLKISQISVPFGVIGVVYESRPNVTFDVFSLCFKSGNATILKGGSEAENSNRSIVAVIKDVLKRFNVDPDIIALLPSDRRSTAQLLRARKYVDLIIPRGSRNLIDYVRSNSSIPVIETGAGICHTYFDESGNREKGRDIIFNAKTRRVSVCNALDCLIVHEKRLADLAFLVEPCATRNVEIFADSKAYTALKDKYPSGLLRRAKKDAYGTEFLSYKMAVKTCTSFDEALEHIEKYGSQHSEAIIADDRERIELFFRLVDASSVYSNASTAFTDGGEFGLGAEIGISTQKLHARGPMALGELTTYKWVIEGNGQTRR